MKASLSVTASSLRVGRGIAHSASHTNMHHDACFGGILHRFGGGHAARRRITAGHITHPHRGGCTLMHPGYARQSHLHELFERLVIVLQAYPVLGLDDCEDSAQLKGGEGECKTWGREGGRERG